MFPLAPTPSTPPSHRPFHGHEENRSGSEASAAHSNNGNNMNNTSCSSSIISAVCHCIIGWSVSHPSHTHFFLLLSLLCRCWYFFTPPPLPLSCILGMTAQVRLILSLLIHRRTERPRHSTFPAGKDGNGAGTGVRINIIMPMHQNGAAREQYPPSHHPLILKGGRMYLERMNYPTTCSLARKEAPARTARQLQRHGERLYCRLLLRHTDINHRSGMGPAEDGGEGRRVNWKSSLPPRQRRSNATLLAQVTFYRWSKTSKRQRWASEGWRLYVCSLS